MSSLSEIESAAAALPAEQQQELLHWLSRKNAVALPKNARAHSVLDIAPVSLGGMIASSLHGGDTLGEMLEGRL